MPLVAAVAGSLLPTLAVSATIGAALISAAVSLALGIVNDRRTRKTQELAQSNAVALVKLQDQIETRQAEETARRDYEYEARKRLYTECEPLIFQLNQACRFAQGRVRNLALGGRRGYLWLLQDASAPTSYHYETVHRFLAPLVFVRLLEQRLTMLDLTLDHGIGELYRFARYLFRVTAHDERLAAATPQLDYAPFEADASTKAKSNPAMYCRQGISGGLLEMAVEAMIIHEKDNPPRCRTLGELQKSASSLPEVKVALELFEGFHPETRPVLWRLLIAEYYLCAAIQQCRAFTKPFPEECLELWHSITRDQDHSQLDWRAPGSGVEDAKVLHEPFAAAEHYLRQLVTRDAESRDL